VTASNRPPVGLQMTAATWAMLAALALLWGCTFFFYAVALPELPPVTLIALRVGGAAAVLWPLVWLRGEAVPVDIAMLGRLALLGIFNNALPFYLIAWGQLRIAGGIAAVLIAMTPLFTVLVAHRMTEDERITPARLAGLVAGLAGVAVLIGPRVLLTLGADLIAQLAVLGAAISYAWAGVYARRVVGHGIPLLTLATWQISFAALAMVPLALVADRPWTLAPPGIGTWLSVAALVLSSTVVAYMLYFRILATAGATNLLLVNFLVPVSAILLGVAVLGDVLLARHYAGMALIALGLACLDGRLWRRATGQRRR
jgi:drug/metabolite transporter (DMT)-like permease